MAVGLVLCRIEVAGIVTCLWGDTAVVLVTEAARRNTKSEGWLVGELFQTRR